MKKPLLSALLIPLIPLISLIALPTYVTAASINKCKACHLLTSAKRKVGPGFMSGDTGKGMQFSIINRKAGTSPGFKYKFTKYVDANKSWIWDEEHLRKWMCNSKAAIKEFTSNDKAKTRMPPQRVCDKERQDEILKVLKGLPNPAPLKSKVSIEAEPGASVSPSPPEAVSTSTKKLTKSQYEVREKMLEGTHLPGPLTN